MKCHYYTVFTLNCPDINNVNDIAHPNLYLKINMFNCIKYISNLCLYNTVHYNTVLCPTN